MTEHAVHSPFHSEIICPLGPHPHKKSTAPVKAQPTPSATRIRLKSLLFLIPSLKPVTNGTSVLAFQNPVMCMYAAVVAATLSIATNNEEVLEMKRSATELMSERNVYRMSEILALELVTDTRPRG